MNEDKFLQILENKVKEQEKLIKNVPFPKIFKIVSLYLGEHPWRFGIPISLIVSFLLHLYFGKNYDNLILKIFGGFGIIKL